MVKQILVYVGDLIYDGLLLKLIQASLRAQKRANLIDVYIWENNSQYIEFIKVNTVEELNVYYDECKNDSFLKPVRIDDTCFCVGPAKSKRFAHWRD